MVFRFGAKYVIHHDARNRHILWRDAPGLHDSFHLNDHNAAAGFCCRSGGKLVELVALPIDGDIALFIRNAAPDQGDIHFGELVKQPFLAVNVNQLHLRLGIFRPVVHRAALHAGVHHRA